MSQAVRGRGKKPDVIYAAEADAVLIGSLLRRVFRVPLVTRFYGVARITPHFDRQTGRLQRLGLRHLASRLAMTRKADLVVVTDDGTNGREIIQAMNPGSANIGFWKNGTDLVETSTEAVSRIRTSCGIGDDDIMLLTVSRLDGHKRVDRAIRALHYVRENGCDHAKLVIVGHGPERAGLQRLTQQLEIADRVTFVGAVEHDQIHAHYRAADIFLSLYDLSNLGNPLWEALAAGRCIVTLSTGGTGRVVVDNVNGRILDVDCDEITLAKRIAGVVTQLAGSPAEREALSAGATEYASRQMWSWDERLRAELDAVVGLLPVSHRRAAG